jgi:hypothetical protein
VDMSTTICGEVSGTGTINPFTLQMFYITVEMQSSSLSTLQ